MKIIVRVLIFLALQALVGSPFAQEPPTPTGGLPAKVLIAGVPYVSWSEAAQLRYEHKNILNPSYVAAAKMIRGYWGQDGARLFQFGPTTYQPDSWKDKEPESGTDLADLKAWLARGVPVAVSLPLTPHAHPVPVTAVLFGIVKGGKLSLSLPEPEPEPGPTSQALGQWASWVDLLGFESQHRTEPGKGVELKSAASSMHEYMNESLHVAWKVVIGYDDERKLMILHDPSFGPAFEMSYDDFESNWRLNDFKYVAHPPQGFADFVARRPATRAYPARTPDMRAATHFAYGYGFSQVGRAADAERELEQGLALPGLGNGWRHLLSLELAHHRNAAGRVNEAVALLRQAIAALPQAPEPYELLSQIYQANPSLFGAQQAAIDGLQVWKFRFNNRDGLRTALRTIPQDFDVPALRRYRGWACEPDFRGSLC